MRHSDRCLPDRVCRKGSDTQIWLVLLPVFVPQIQGELLTAGCITPAPGASPCVLCSGSECGLCSWSWATCRSFPIPAPAALSPFQSSFFLASSLLFSGSWLGFFLVLQEVFADFSEGFWHRSCQNKITLRVLVLTSAAECPSTLIPNQMGVL